MRRLRAVTSLLHRPLSTQQSRREDTRWTRVCVSHSLCTRSAPQHGLAFRDLGRISLRSQAAAASLSLPVRGFSTSIPFWRPNDKADSRETAEGADGRVDNVNTEKAPITSPNASLAMSASREDGQHTEEAVKKSSIAESTSASNEENANAAQGSKTPTDAETGPEKAETKEEAESTAATESVSAEDAFTPEGKAKHERLLDAEKRLRIEEIFAQDAFQQFIHTTEVSTPSGLRWLDVSASPEFFEDPLMAHVPEGQFAYSVMRKLLGSRFPIGLCASVASGAALPATYVDDNWACLILRSTKEVLEGDGASRLKRRPGLSSFGRKLYPTAADYDVDRAALVAGKKDDYVYDEATDDFYPRQVRASQQWAQQLMRRLTRLRQDSEATASSDSRASKEKSASEAAREALAVRRRRRLRGRRGASSYRSPLTMSDFTDRLTVFIGKELHPVEKDPDAPAPVATTKEAEEALALSFDRDRKLVSNPSTSVKQLPKKQPFSASAEDTESSTNYEVRWRVITVHRSPVTFIRDMQSQWNKLTSRHGRPVRTMRTVPAHNHESLDGQDAIKQALRRAARPASMAEEEDEENGYGDAHNTVVDRVEGWEDLLRLLYHGAARTLQESAYRNTRRLEMLETEMFDAPDNSAEHLRSMTRLMAELHLLSREATIHNAILRESKVAYQKLKRVLDHPIDLADQRELLYVDSVLSISAHLEEQSESLLFLQFSVAMNQTEQHLRTLTIFNTIFIPLDFICTCCGSEIFTTSKFSQSKEAMYAVFGLMGATTVVTLRWIRRNLR